MMDNQELKILADQFISLAQQGLSPEEISMRIMDKQTAELLRHCALLRRFDRAAFAIAVQPVSSDSDADLKCLVERGDVQHPMPEHDIYLTSFEFRKTHLAGWQMLKDIPTGVSGGSEATIVQTLHLKLAEHFGGLGTAWELETLHHRLGANPEAGLDFMEQLLDKRLPQSDPDSDGALDATTPEAIDGIAVARALDVLDVAEEQSLLGFVPDSLKKACIRARGEVDTWSYWCDDWFRTRRYIQRPRIQGWFTALHESTGQRVLEISAPGGSGKTMVLRWLITHHCLPRHKPIAHLDFDRYIGRPQKPWQLLLRCVGQLNRQFADAPFNDIIQKGLDLESTLSLMTDNSNIDSFNHESADRFIQVINSTNFQPLILVVDTFEEALAMGTALVVEFIAMLMRCARSCPSLRLVICGRYPLTHLDFDKALKNQYPEEYGFYAAQLRQERLPLFDHAESDAYLLKRGVCLAEQDLDKVFEAAVGITDGNGNVTSDEVSPFHLSLIADLIRDRQEKGREIDSLLREIDHVKVIYLIERVISRIRDVGVRWLLRYGVVPRRLTREFFEQVIINYLQQINRNTFQDVDDPSKDALPDGLQESSLYFSESTIFEQGEAATWDGLLTYASPDSWVKIEDDA
jgi:hypothetical protein